MDRLLLTVFLCVCLVPLVFSADYDYVIGGENGPGNWPGICASGKKQSPINIKMATTEYKAMPEFVLKNYNTMPQDNYTLTNSGHTLKVGFPTNFFNVSGGGLEGVFTTAQFHLHWGKTNNVGSEHTMDMAYPAEIHFVSYNTKYADLGAAVPKSDGLAVLGVFIEVGGDSDNPAYEFLKYADDVIKAGNKTSIMPFKLEPMLPDTRDKFFRYSGSLTTPTCDESVTWTVFKDSVKISQKQMNYLRMLEFTDGSKMVNNYRPVQELNMRTVYNSFEKQPSAGADILDISVGLFSLMLLTALFGR